MPGGGLFVSADSMLLSAGSTTAVLGPGPPPVAVPDPVIVMATGLVAVLVPNEPRLHTSVPPVKGGVGMLALESGAPLLPVRIEGSFRVLPKGGFFLKRHAVHVRIGPPISVDSYDPGDTGSPQEAIRRLSEDAHRAVEALS